MTAFRGNKVSMIFQNPMTCLNPVYTIGNQLVEALRAHDKKISKEEAQKRAMEMMELVGINNGEKRMKQYPHELSGGMRQRVMIAMALCCQPRLLIADEPTTALDVTIQAQILQLLKQLNENEQINIILITHDLGVVAQTCDRIAVMYGGRLCEVGGKREVLGGPLHPYTRGLIDCQPASEGGQGRLTIIDGQPPSADHFPSGCRFHPRCRRADEACQSQPLLRYGQGCHSHAVACHHILPARQEG